MLGKHKGIYADRCNNFGIINMECMGLLTNFRQIFANIKLSKTQLSKMIQLGGFLGRLLGSLRKNGL